MEKFLPKYLHNAAYICIFAEQINYLTFSPAHITVKWYIMTSSINVDNFDFTGKRVKYNGRSLTKFDICYLIDEIKYSYAVIRCDVLKYAEAVDELLKVLYPLWQKSCK